MRADAGVHMSLLSTVYSQSWPAPDPVRGPRKGFFGKRPREAATNKVERPKSAAPFLQIQGRTINPGKATTARSKSAIGVRTSNGSGDAPTPTSLNGQLGLDKGTLHWKSWSSYKLDCEQEPDDLSLYRLTTETFRRLSQQVKDVSQQLNGNYHNSGFKSYYIVDDKTVPALRRSQLAASLPSQPPSICSPTPNESVSFKPSEDLQCTTVRGTPRKKRPQSSFVRSTRVKAKHPPRPKSSFATILGNDDDNSSSETKDAEINNAFDQITPKVIEKLAEGEDKEFTKTQPGPFNIVKEVEKSEAGSDEENEDSSDEEGNDDNDDGGSGDDDGGDEDGGDEDEEEEDDSNHVKKRSRKKVETDHSNDEAYDNEIRYRYRETPDLDLLPEDLDDDGIRGKIDYNTSNMPKKWQSSHPEPLRPPWCHMDLLELSEFKNWRREVRMVPDGIEEHVMDRLIEMEKLQADTAHWERCQGKGSSRPPSLQVRKGWNADAAVPTERAQSALSKPKQSKNCVENCMQLACVGDCRVNQPDRGGCPYCKQLYCTGSCAEYDYHLYVRTARGDDDVIPTRPKSCRSCRVSSNKNSVKSTVNANTVVLGRPKSAFATFSSAKHQAAKPKAFAVSQTAGAEQVSNDLARLGLKAPTEKLSDDDGKERPHTAKSRSRPKGRDAILPGKSFQSQRRNSLTEDLISTSACSMNSRALRARSARMRAQKRCKSAKK